MKLKGRFEKQQLQVGLSAELPLVYRGPEEKYTLADWLTRAVATEVRYEKRSFDFELEMTTDELVRTSDLFRCFRIISAMPEIALVEVEKELLETYEHYSAIKNTENTRALLPPAREVKATVSQRLKT